MSKIFNPTQEQKQLILNALFYEIELLIGTSSTHTIVSSFHRDDDDLNMIINLALLESTLLHARNLLEFFEKSTRYKDNVLANDYGFSPQKITIKTEYRDRLNKDLVHLTYSRLNRTTLEESSWDYKQLVHPILDRSKEFIEYLLSGNLPQNNKPTIQNCEAILEKITQHLNLFQS